jgi:adenylate cyclase
VAVEFAFGDHLLDVDRRELRRGGALIALEPQVFDLLVCLVQNRDHVVSMDDVLETVWGGRIVSESTLRSRINAVRKAVGDSGAAQHLIRTVPRKGIRFVGVVRARGVERRLAAILAADVAGYSRLMGLDEEGTRRTLRAHRATIDPLIGRHGGRIVSTAGDSILAEFASPLQALRAALALQQALASANAELPEASRMQFRVGINLGDVMVEGDDLLGDGVNIAARLQEIAEPGGICISAKVHEEISGKLDAEFADLGDRELKNIARPVRVFQVGAGIATREAVLALPLPDKPSIAVLPFQNMSGDPEQEYFADGMVEEIITALSRIRWLFVIARNSSFTYKGRPVDVRQVGRELGVRYVLEGSVRKAETRVRIAAQLIDALSGAHLWAHRFDGELGDVFELQDRVAASVAGVIEPTLRAAEVERARHERPGSLDAYDLYLRAVPELDAMTAESTTRALTLLRRALGLDPGYAAALALAAICYMWRFLRHWMADEEAESAEAVRLARASVAATARIRRCWQTPAVSCCW